MSNICRSIISPRNFLAWYFFSRTARAIPSNDNRNCSRRGSVLATPRWCHDRTLLLGRPLLHRRVACTTRTGTTITRHGTALGPIATTPVPRQTVFQRLCLCDRLRCRNSLCPREAHTATWKSDWKCNGAAAAANNRACALFIAELLVFYGII